MAQKWTLSDIPDQSGKTAVITGGNTGLGLKTALELCRRGAEVVIGSRSIDNGEAAVAQVKAEVPDAQISYGQLDLTEPDSIERFSKEVLGDHDRLDILLHNAGIVFHREHTLTATGRELHMQINHLGHYALTCHLMPLIEATENARIVQSTTVPYQKGCIDFDDFDWKAREYKYMQAYFDSRLAQLLFAFALNQKFKAADHSAQVISMQPGLVNTEGLQNSDFGGWWLKALAQPLEKGCRTHLRTCTDPAVTAGQFWEPKFAIFGATKGKVLKAEAVDGEVAAKLMEVSAELIGLKF